MPGSGHFAWPPTDVEDQEGAGECRHWARVGGKGNRAAPPGIVRQAPGLSLAIIGLPILLPLYFSAHWSSHARECVSTAAYCDRVAGLDANLRDPLQRGAPIIGGRHARVGASDFVR